MKLYMYMYMNMNINPIYYINIIFLCLYIMFNVVICGVVKNAAKHLSANMEAAISLGQQCDKYKIVIYENNSTDDTKAILSSYNAARPEFQILSEDIDSAVIKEKSKIWAYTRVTGSDHPCRIEQISNARNKLVNELQKESYDDYTYVVMIDFDSKMFTVEGILESLRLVKENRKRVIYANSPSYYDYYALRSAHSDYNLFGPEVIGDHFWQWMAKEPLRIEPSPTAALVPVYSAFNGIGVYAMEVFTSHFYDVLPNAAVKNVYRKIAETHADAYAKFYTILQAGCAKFSGGERDELFFWKNNSGYDKPVLCEHVAFNFALIEEGCEIYINPRMLYLWN